LTLIKFSDSQHGFRAKRSCETQLILTLEDILKTTSKGKQIDIALLDFSKSFASGQSFGTLPSSSDLLKRYVIVGVISSAISFKNQP
jgi:hypothetical protein